MSRKYEVSESVGKSWEEVDSYESIEKHHPTWPEDEEKRNYSEIDGSREEYVNSPTGQRMVSKDFVLSVDNGYFVDVPSPASGYIRRSPRLDRWGTIEIYDRQGEDAELIARVRHMEPIHVQDGQRVEYGQLLGRQGNKAPPGVRVGLHIHIDFNEWRLNYFREYFRDLESGAITSDGRINDYLKNSQQRHMDREGVPDRWLRSTPSASAPPPLPDITFPMEGSPLRPHHDQSLPPGASLRELFDHMYAALETGDDRIFRQALTTVANSPGNREFWSHVSASVDAHQREAALQAQLREQAQQMQQMQMERQGPVMSLGFSR